MGKLNWLDEVKADAEYITKKRIRDYQEEQAHKASKRDVAEVEEVVVEEVTEEVIKEQPAEPTKAKRSK